MLITVEPRTPAPASVYGARTDTTGPGRKLQTVHVSTTDKWPHAVFMAWLDQLKESRDIPSDMQLAQRAKISAPSVISGWRTGRTQPSKENLRKIANYAGEAPVTLWRLAGLVDDGDLDAPELAPSEPLPRQIQDLITLYRGADKSARKVILGQVEFLVNAMTER